MKEKEAEQILKDAIYRAKLMPHIAPQPVLIEYLVVIGKINHEERARLYATSYTDDISVADLNFRKEINGRV